MADTLGVWELADVGPRDKVESARRVRLNRKQAADVRTAVVENGGWCELWVYVRRP